jgi:hypothetical protein
MKRSSFFSNYYNITKLVFCNFFCSSSSSSKVNLATSIAKRKKERERISLKQQQHRKKKLTRFGHIFVGFLNEVSVCKGGKKKEFCIKSKRNSLFFVIILDNYLSI